MIDIKDSVKCCGCSACVQSCPKQCITMKQDMEGFLYPIVDKEKCVDCHICENVCPVIHPFKPSEGILLSYACRTNDEDLRQQSSSGGLFTLLAKYIIAKGGVVFGAAFDDEWNVRHEFTDSIEGLSKFRGSKYVQSIIGTSYQDAKNILNHGRLVLFTGTSCQIAGLKHYLKCEYDNLYTIDIVCHSVPSPKVWSMYLKSLTKDPKKDIVSITFRSKINGWRDYSLRILTTEKILVSETKTKNTYMKGFLKDLYTRPSCSSCPARNYTSGSDLMLADSWGLDIYHPEWDDNKGMSLLLVKTNKGKKLVEHLDKDIFFESIPYAEVEDRGLHAPIRLSSKPHVFRRYFYSNFNQDNLIPLIDSCLLYGDIYYSIRRQVKNVIKKLVPFYFNK